MQKKQTIDDNKVNGKRRKKDYNIFEKSASANIDHG